MTRPVSNIRLIRLVPAKSYDARQKRIARRLLKALRSPPSLLVLAPGAGKGKA